MNFSELVPNIQDVKVEELFHICQPMRPCTKILEEKTYIKCL